ncbi:hypothetical protein HMN09_01426000 [Mycena chlorophos]|uniref:Uncharacterized protein n=1 Tax=Mycena chlorophos TaxID=658473 RepID=A0A8H6RUJ9_MYCCL|nr:hypothetical protein HMN09_01426000 [Mycena chlorophos]
MVRLKTPPKKKDLRSPAERKIRASIRTLHASGLTQADLARTFDRTAGEVFWIIHDKYSSVTDDLSEDRAIALKSPRLPEFIQHWKQDEIKKEEEVDVQRRLRRPTDRAKYGQKLMGRDLQKAKAERRAARVNVDIEENSRHRVGEAGPSHRGDGVIRIANLPRRAPEAAPEVALEAAPAPQAAPEAADELQQLLQRLPPNNPLRAPPSVRETQGRRP